MKVLIFVILLSTLNFIKFAKSLNITYILKQRHDYYEPNCIAEEDLLDSPIGWIYPLPKDKTDIPKTTSRFVPDVPNNYSCNFENGNLCFGTWLLSTEKWALKTDFGLILDSRWEGFPTLLTAEKEYYEVTQSSFNFGFSVRSSGNIEVLLCEGWNPKSYPCYYINIGDTENKMIYLRKIDSMEDLKKKGDKLDAYKYYSKVLFEDEWRNFEISYNGIGRITLLEVFTGKILINYKDPQPLNLLYILPRSKTPTLWKIHKNQFLHTEEEGITKLGRGIETPSSVLCVSLYASLCENCSMTFSIKDEGERKDVERIIGNKSDLKWRHVKLIVENITSDSVDLYVETTKPEIPVDSKPFWSIDDIRICNIKEIKISTLASYKLTSTESEYIYCQSVLHQKWRPTKHVQQSLPVFPGIETTAHNNSIELVLIPNISIIPSLSYLIHFQGEDICLEKSNKNRVKSSGFIITRDHKTIINNLVPYTHYNIEFSYLLEDKIKNKSESTLPTDVPTEEEVPQNVTIEASEFDAVLYWQKPQCKHIYGPLFYLVKLSNETNYKELEGAEPRFKFENLEPFSKYQAEIIVARWRHNYHSDTLAKKTMYSFTTNPAVAPAVRNLEVYSIDEHQVALRYDLPPEPRGIPKFVQVSWFDRLLNTRPRANVTEIKRCKLWPEKYCVDLEDLVANRVMQISVSLKNAETHMFGKDSTVEVYTTHNRVPGKPSNLTYKVVDCRPDNDYCHLNISWRHPYQQNTTITSFNINLNKTISNKVSSHITELLKIYNGNYQPVYNFQIKYIPYSTHYRLFVQSVHDEYKSDFESIYVKTDDIGDHIDQSPKLKDATNSTVVFETPELDPRLNATILTAIVQDYDESKKLNKTALGLELHEYNFCNAFGDTWIAKIVQLSKEPQNLVIGDGTTKYSPELKRHVVNKPLLPNTKYCLTFIVRNKYDETEHEVVYYEKEITTSEVQNEKLIQPQNIYTHLYMLFIVLLLIPAGFLLYRYIQKRKARRKRNQVGEENVYESLPFEECENCVYNNTYDKLMHS